jgi:lipid A 4'-phosphatase
VMTGFKDGRAVVGKPFTAGSNPPRQAVVGTGDDAAQPVRAVVRRCLVSILLPLLALIALTILFRDTDADIRICRCFYQGGYCRWSGLDGEPCRSLYRYGPLPGLVLGLVGVGMIGTSFFKGRSRRLGRAGVFLTLHLALGPGLLVNGLFKPCWNRPRPKETAEFGGPLAFVPLLSSTSRSEAKSFPSGHAAMGFFLISPAFLLYRRRARLAVACYLLGMCWGTTVGLARIAEGGHYPSDILWAWAIVHFTGVLAGITVRPRFTSPPGDGMEVTPRRSTATATQLATEGVYQDSRLRVA